MSFSKFFVFVVRYCFSSEPKQNLGRGVDRKLAHAPSHHWVKSLLAIPRRRPTILSTVGQGPITLAVGAGWGGLDIFTLNYPFSSFSLSLGDGPI